jgi:hypothetical protein
MYSRHCFSAYILSVQTQEGSRGYKAMAAQAVCSADISRSLEIILSHPPHMLMTRGQVI